MKFFSLDSIARKLLVPTMLLASVVLGALGTAMVVEQDKVLTMTCPHWRASSRKP